MKQNAMKIFEADAYINSGCGCCSGEDYHIVIVANTIEEALGLALDYHPDTLAKHWDLHEVDVNFAHVHTYESRVMD